MPEQQNIRYLLYRTFWRAVDALYPPTCAGCGKKGARWCPACQDRARLIKPPLCPCCGQQQARPSICPRCQASPPRYKAARAWAVFDGPVRGALHRLKYKGDLALGDTLACPLIAGFPELGWQVDLVVPVSLGVARLAERGYNQAALIAYPFALGLNLPYSSRALAKIRETRSQVDLNVAQRKENVAGAFQAHTGLVKNRTVLVIDDVATSGATLDACAAALLEAGAGQVYGLTFARAVVQSPRVSAQ